ncbi:TRAP transporter substrate-binding protein [Chitinasiproducens palmae]|uniref:Tripartite ATP-independent transporter solute receptor, DctP family n=1 Tax=Chitinasiproducens palmae TaxID=1770053 RepID=A0A1H2PPP3_9BURK|nr:TRAP transporter substrate-binding protein [Chitinasiproducens palmae]SDV48655.1 tripartite ATP-independent transporter solute receptor, DctP family [Chitinasiproducens palmae]
MHQKRRQFLLQGTATAAVAATGVLGAPWIRRAQAAEFVYKLGHDLPASHPFNKRLLEAAEMIKRDSDGRLEIRLFPNNQLGGDPDMFAQMRSGALEIFASSGANTLSSLVPKTAIWTVGFAFKDYSQVFGALDGELGAYLRGLINKAGLEVQQNVWDNGFRQITSGAKPILSPADLKGMKFRVPPGRLWISLFSALGASPATISFNEVYLALQSKLVEGQENALAIIDSAKLYEVQKYCSLTSHAWDGFWLVSNRQTWQRLPSNLRDIASKHLNAQALKERQDVAALNASLQKSLEAKGMVFNAPDIQPFREMLRKSGYYGEMQKTFGAEEWGLLEKVTGRLA